MKAELRQRDESLAEGEVDLELLKGRATELEESLGVERSQCKEWRDAASALEAQLASASRAEVINPCFLPKFSKISVGISLHTFLIW